MRELYSQQNGLWPCMLSILCPWKLWNSDLKCGPRTGCISITWMYQKYSARVQPYKRTYGSSSLWAQNQQVEPRDQRVMNVLVLAASKERPQILQGSVAELSRQGILLGDIPASMVEGQRPTLSWACSVQGHAFYQYMFKDGDWRLSGMENLVL